MQESEQALMINTCEPQGPALKENEVIQAKSLDFQDPGNSLSKDPVGWGKMKMSIFCASTLNIMQKILVQ